MTKPVMLLIMDGWGENSKKDSNSVFLGKTPNIDRLKKELFPASISRMAGR